MSMLEGEIDSNWRYNSRTGLFVQADITAEEQLVQEFQEFPGNYGFTLNEVPDISSLSITEVKRVSDSKIFTHTTNTSVGNTEFFFDYSNDSPILFFNSINNGEVFKIKYKGLGGAVNSKNLLSIASRAGNFETRLQSLMRTNPLNITLTNQNVYIYNGWATVNNLTIVGNCEIRPNTPDAIGIIEILGDLMLSNISQLKTYRTIFLIHGSIKVLSGTAEIVGQAGGIGGDGNSHNPIAWVVYYSGGAGGGTGNNAGAGIYTVGGAGGCCIYDQHAQSNAAGAVLGSSNGVTGDIGGGGGGGVLYSNGGVPPTAINNYPGNGGIAGGGGGGGGGYYQALGIGSDGQLHSGGGAGGAESVFHGRGGDGGTSESYTGGTVSGLGGGAGGGGGGSGMVFFVLGQLSPDVTFITGRGGMHGAGGLAGAGGAGVQSGQSGSIYLYSKYTGTPPGAFDVSAVTDGSAGNTYFRKLGSASNYTIFEINYILNYELSAVQGLTNWRIADKLAVTI